MSNPEMHNHELKLRRADEHLAMLDEQIDDWMDGAYHYYPELDSQTGEKQIRVRVLNPPPATLRLIIGDCLHNFRSALDNLAYELAVAHQRGPLPYPYFQTAEFPIFKRPMSTKERKRKIGCVHPSAQRIVKKLQPYQHRTTFWLDPLWQLHQLNNVDKHRLPNVIQFATGAVAYFPDEPNQPANRQIYMGPLTDGARIASYTPPPDEPADVVNPHLTFLHGLHFASSTYMINPEVLATLRSIHSHIRERVLPLLDEYLPDPEWFNSVVR